MQLNNQKIILVLPVFNEEKCLRQNTELVLDFLKQTKIDMEIIIADNGSTDKTRDVSKSLEQKYSSIRYLRTKEAGRGLAIKMAWQKYIADINIYMDIDLSTDLSAIPNLIKEINEGNDIVIGSRYLKNSKSKRKFIRKILSKIYLIIIHLLFNSEITDYQCGFKAVNKKVVNYLLQINDDKWFFDTELLLKAEKKGYKIKEIPITWLHSKNRKSRVKPITLSIKFLLKIIKLRLVYKK